jgi:tRNA (guanosine-2'-O-)-methyltransferase
MNQPLPSDLWEVLRSRFSAPRQQRLLEVASKRTSHIRLVLQDVHLPHNISACLRSAEALGVLHCDIVRMKTSRFKPSGAARGVESWLQVHSFSSISDCALSLKEQGYKLVAAIPRQEAVPLDQVVIDQPLAVLFGNEHSGVDPLWNEYIDGFFTIPMCGMVESLNISVSAAISLFSLTQRMQALLSAEAYYLSSVQQQALLGEWVSRQVPSWELEYSRVTKYGKSDTQQIS